MSDNLNTNNANDLLRNSPKLGDLFCGVGGFSLGAHLAGFHSVFAVDCDVTLTSSFSTNFPHTKLLLRDLGTCSPASILSDADLKPGDLDGIIGGPPCQGFSVMGHRDPNDPRNSLLGSYFEFVSYAQPAFFVMENVPHIMAEQYSEILAAGIAKVSTTYTVLGPLLVDASKFGAATKRVRAVVIGYDATKMDPITVEDIRALERNQVATVQHAIHDLPGPGMTEADDWHNYLQEPAAGQAGEYARRARQVPPLFLSKDAIREAAGRRVNGLQNTVHSQRVIDRMGAMAPGSSDRTSRAKRLSWDQTCTVLRAGTGPERGSHQAVRPIHPEHARVITVREAARIQGFPDWFQFHETKWHSFRMIGNSVSPYLSEAILTMLKGKLLANVCLNEQREVVI